MNAPQNPQTVPPKPQAMMDVDLARLPPVVRTLAAAAEALPDAAVKAEAHRQWPHLYGRPEWWGWFPETITKARDHIKGYVVGIALGVTRLEAPPVTAVVQAAVGVDRAVTSPEWQKARARRTIRAGKRAAQAARQGGSQGAEHGQ